MRNKILTFTLLLFSIVATQAQNENLALTFENAEFTTDGVMDFYEVDILAQKTTGSPDFKLGNGLIYLDYNTTAFGSSIADMVEFTRPAGSILASTLTLAPIAVYTNFLVNNNDSDTFVLVWTQDFAESAYDINITDTATLLLHLKIEILDTNVANDLCFNTTGDGGTFGMNIFSACGSLNGGPFDDEDCVGFPGLALTFDGSDCSGSEVPMDLCDGGLTTWETTTGWDNGTPDNTMSAVINGVYVTGTDGDLDICELTVTATGDLRVSALGNAVIQNDITVDGALIIEHTANLVQINDAATVTNNGTINVLVTTALVDTRDFVMLGTPMSMVSREDVWSSSFNVQSFSPELFVPFAPQEMGVVYNFQSQDLTVWSPHSGLINPAEGYLVFPQTGYTAPGGQFDYSYDLGTLNNGEYVNALNYNGTQDGSPNILSNPYPSAIDADAFFMENPTIDAVYFWEHGDAPSSSIPGPNPVNFTMRDVSAYNGTGGVMAASGAGTEPNGIIATAQGFGIFASGPDQSVVFNNSIRTTAANTTLRTADVNKDRLWLRVEDLTYGEGSNALIGFLDAATAGLDSRYDSPLVSNVTSLYSYIADDYSAGYTIQGRESFSMDAIVNLGFSSLIEDEVMYKISLSDFDGAAWDQAYIYLVDNETGITTNLNKDNYTFSAEKGVHENRFYIKFQNQILGVEDDALSNISIFPNPTEKFLNVTSSGQVIKSISVVNIEGRTVMTLNDIDQTDFSLDVSRLRSAVYFVKVETSQGVDSIKFIRK